MICPYCNKEFFNGNICPRCGQAIASVCPRCGNLSTGNFCSFCGAKITGLPNPVIDMTSTKNKWVAFFLCLFLGMFGIHRFYVGKIGTGVLWLLLFVVASKIWAIMLLVDLIWIVMGKFKDKEGRYLR